MHNNWLLFANWHLIVSNTIVSLLQVSNPCYISLPHCCHQQTWRNNCKQILSKHFYNIIYILQCSWPKTSSTKLFLVNLHWLMYMGRHASLAKGLASTVSCTIHHVCYKVIFDHETAPETKTTISWDVSCAGQLVLFASWKKPKHRHRRNVTSHHSFSLLWQF